MISRKINKKEETNYFAKAAITAGILGGGIYGINKFSGPLKKAIENITQKNTQSIIEKELEKRKNVYDKSEILKTNSFDNLYKIDSMELNYRNTSKFQMEIAEIEETLIKKLIKISRIAYQRNNVLPEFTEKLITEIENDKNGLISSVKDIAIKKYEYIYGTGKNFESDVNFLRIYRQILGDRNRQLGKHVLRIFPIREKTGWAPFEFEDIKKILVDYNYSNSSVLIDRPGIITVKTGNELASTMMRDKSHIIRPNSIESISTVKSLPAYNSANNLTKGLLNVSIDATTNRSIDYIPELRKLQHALIEKSRHVTGMVVDHNNCITIETFDMPGGGQNKYAKMQFMLEDKPIVVKIPLSLNNIMPNSKSAFGITSFDKLIQYRDATHANYSMQMIDSLILAIDGENIERNIGNTKDLQKSLNRRIIQVQQLLARDSGQLRDFAKLGVVEHQIDFLLSKPKRASSSIKMLKQANRGYELMKAMRNQGDTIVISLDFETLTKSKIGDVSIGHTAREPITKVYQMGIMAAELTPKGFKIIDSDDFVNMNTINDILSNPTKDNIKWARKITGKETDEAALEEFRRMMQDRANRQRVKINSDHDMVQQLKNMIESYKKQGKRVIFSGKNIIDYDITVLRNMDPMLADFLRDNVIDTQRLLTAKYFGMKRNKTLTLSTVVRHLLGMNNEDFSDITKVINRSENLIGEMNSLSIADNIRGKLLMNAGSAHFPTTDLMYNMILLSKQFNDMVIGNDDLAQWMESPAFREMISGYETDYMRRNMRQIRKNDSPIGERGIAGYGAITSNMAKKATSIFSASDFLIFGDVKNTKQWDQLFYGERIRYVGQNKQVTNALRSYINYYGDYSLSRASAAPRLGADYKVLKKILAPLSSRAPLDADSLFNADSQAMGNYFMHKVVADTTLVYNAYQGTGGMLQFNKKFFNDVGIQFESTVRMDGLDIELTAELENLYQDSMRIARDLAKSRGTSITPEIYYEASIIASKTNEIRFGSKERTMIGTGKRGAIFKKYQFGGKVRAVIPDQNSAGKVTGWIIKVLHDIKDKNGIDVLGHEGFTARSVANKARAGLLESEIADSIMGSADALGSFDALEKGYVGSIKTMVLEDTVVRLQEKIAHGDVNAIKELNKLAAKINAEVLPGTLVKKETTEEVLRKLYTSLPKNLTDRQLRHTEKYFGNVELSFSELLELAKTGARPDDIWDKTTLNEFYRRMDSNFGNKFGSYKQMVNDMIQKGIKSIEKSISNKEMGLHSLSNDHVQMMISNYRNDMLSMLLPEEGQFKFLRDIAVNPNASAQDREYVLGYRGHMSHAIGGLNDGQHGRFKFIKFKASYMLQFDDRVSESMKQFIKSNEAYLSDPTGKLAEVRTVMDRYHNMSFSDNFTNHSMTINEFTMRLANKENKEAYFERVNKLIRNSKNLSTITKEKLLQNTILSEERIDDIVKIIRSNSKQEADAFMAEFKDRFPDQNVKTLTGGTFSHHTLSNIDDVSNISKLAVEKHNLIAIDVKNLSLSFDIDATIDKLTKETWFKDDNRFQNKTEVKAYLTKLMSSANENMKKFGKSAVDFENGHVKLNYLMLHAFETPELIQKMATESFWSIASDDMKVKLSLSQQLSQAQKTFLDGKSSADQLNSEKTNIIETWIRSALGTKDIDTAFQSSFEYRIPGLAGKHISIEKVVSNAMQIKGLLDKEGQAACDRILNSSIDTVFITRNFLDKAKVHVDGNLVSFSKHLENTLGDDAFKKIISGEEHIFGGGLLRYPITQAGKDGLFNARIQVLQDNVARKLGMDHNTFYAHAFMTGLQGADNDGDNAYLILRAMSTIDTMDEFRKETNQTLNTWMQTTEFRKRQQELLGNMISFKKGKITVPYVNSEGVFQIKNIDASDFNVEKFLSPAAETARSFVANMPKFVTPEFTRYTANHAAFAAAAKEFIGESTNLVTNRLIDIAIAGGKIENKFLSAITGNMKYGLSGISQAVISAGKHEKDTAKMAAAWSFMTKAGFDPTKATEEQVFAFKDVWHQGFLDAFDDKDMAKSMADESFSILTDKITTIDKLKRYNPEFAMIERIMSDTLIQRDRNSSMQMGILAGQNMDMIRENISSAMKNMLEQEFLIEEQTPFSSFKSMVKDKLQLSSTAIRGFKDLSKFGAIGAGVYLMANIFTPYSNSDSISSTHAYKDLGELKPSLELPNEIPLDKVNASFSKEAFIKMSGGKGDSNKDKGVILNNLTSSNMLNSSIGFKEFKNNSKYTYADYTTYIGNFGSRGREFKRLDYI